MQISFNKKLIEEWLGYANDGDEIKAFVCRFIAFNCLYENCAAAFNEGGKSEKDKIGLLLINLCEFGMLKYNPIESLKKEFSNPELIKKGTRSDGFQKENILVEANENHTLFENIYRVRCNLFHGSKTLADINSRSYELVKESAFVLKEFFDNFDKTHGEHFTPNS